MKLGDDAMKLEYKAGPFTLSTHTDGFPHWQTLEYEGAEIARFHHSELVDLEHIIKRMRINGRANLSPLDQHEYD